MNKLLMKKLLLLELDRLQEVLDYDPETGVFTWRVRLSPMCKMDQPAGRIQPDGYRRIAIDRVNYPAHHLAWFHFYGEPAESELDFKDLDRANTRIANLRLATPTENARNKRKPSSNSTGFKGVATFNNPRNRKHYRAQIRVEGKRIHLGLFRTPEEAYAAYCKKAKEVHGEFVRLA